MVQNIRKNGLLKSRIFSEEKKQYEHKIPLLSLRKSEQKACRNNVIFFKNWKKQQKVKLA